MMEMDISSPTSLATAYQNFGLNGLGDLLIKIIGVDEERTMYIIDVGEKYAKRTHTKLFQGIVNNLSETNNDIEGRLKSIVFINTAINYCHQSILSRILIELKDTGIF